MKQVIASLLSKIDYLDDLENRDDYAQGRLDALNETLKEVVEAWRREKNERKA